MMHMARSWLHLALLFCVGAYADPIVDPLSAGQVLVATTNLHGTSFEKTVILITQHDHQGTLGIAINRPAHEHLDKFFPGFHAKSGKLPLFLGGPVHPLALFILARTKAQKSWTPIMADVYFTGGVTAYRFLKQPPNELPESGVRVFAGYAGWGGGQLESEIQRGDWLTVTVDPDIIFSSAPEQSWEFLHRLHSGKWI